MLPFVDSPLLLSVLSLIKPLFRSVQPMSYKNPDLTIVKIDACLEYVKVSMKDYLKDSELLSALEQLNGGPFDQETFEELWDQCKLNSKGEAKVQDFMEFIIKAEEILIEKMFALDTSIAKLELQKKPEVSDYSEQKKYREQMDNLKEQKNQTKKCLNIIRKPFLQYNKIQTALLNQVNQRQVISQIPEERPENQLFEYEISTTPQFLQKILYWTIFLAAITWLGSQLFNRFIDLTLCGIILIGYGCQAISRKIVKLNLLLLVFSFTISFLWLILYTNSVWQPSKNYDYPIMNTPYLKISIILLILGQGIKLILVYYYLTQLHINQVEVFAITLFSNNIFMQNQPYPPNPNKHPLGYALQNVFNTKIEDGNIIEP